MTNLSGNDTIEDQSLLTFSLQGEELTHNNPLW